MAIERVELSGSTSGEEMAPVASTPAAQNQAAPAPGENKPRGRESSAKKDSERDTSSPETSGIDRGLVPVPELEPAGQADDDRPPHRVDSQA